MKSDEGLFLFLRQETGLCAVGNDLVEKENLEMGVAVKRDKSRSNVLKKVREDGLQSPGGGAGLR